MGSSLNKKTGCEMSREEERVVALHKLAFGNRVVWTRARVQQIRDAMAVEPGALPCSSEGTDCSTPQATIRHLPRHQEWIYHNCQKRCLSHVINDTVNLPKLKALPD